MADRDGTTCGTCLTLNPPGAPACVRCNTPLAGRAPGGPAATPPIGTAPRAAGSRTDPGPAAAEPTRPDPTLGSKQLGPGLAAAPVSAPGSSRDRAVAVQPPGYGLDDPAGDPAGEPAPAPEPDTAVARRVTVVGLVLVAVVLVVGAGAMWLTRARYLDSADVQAAVGAELTRRGGAPVTVDCPGDPRHHGGETFGCVASDTAGGRRAVTVTVLDDDGRYRWELAP